MSRPAVDIKGLIQNTLSTGSSLEAAIGELIDGSFDAGAKHVHIYLDTKAGLLIVADDGCGMSKEKMEESLILHKRSEVSSARAGRFGFGMKQAHISVTRHKAASIIISKTIDSTRPDTLYEGMYEITADWKGAVEQGEFKISAHEITRAKEALWGKYAVNTLKKGTVVVIPCPPEVWMELKEKIEKNDLGTNLIWYLGWTYSGYMSAPRSAQIQIRLDSAVEGKLVTVPRIDPLCWDMLPATQKKEVKCILMKKDSTLRAYVQEENGMLVYYNSAQTNSKKGTDRTGFKRIGEFTVQCACSETGWSEQKGVLVATGMVAGQPLTQKDLVTLGGEYNKRNDKIINKFDIVKPGAGDHDWQAYWLKCRFRNVFTSEQDEVWNVLVNKAEMKKDLIHPSVRNAIAAIQNQFRKEQYSRAYESSDEEDESASTTRMKSAPPLDLNSFGLTSAPSTRSAAPPPLTQPSATAPSKLSAASATTPAPSVLVPPNAKIAVSASVRTTSKSERDIIHMMLQISTKYTPHVLKEKLATASDATVVGYAEVYNTLEQVLHILEKKQSKP